MVAMNDDGWTLQKYEVAHLEFHRYLLKIKCDFSCVDVQDSFIQHTMGINPKINDFDFRIPYKNNELGTTLISTIYVAK